MAARSKYFPTLEEDFLLEETKPDESTKLIPDILVDADALVALVKTNDSNHKKLIQITKSIKPMCLCV